MRVVREQPRLVTAKALGLLCLAACGVVLGMALGGDSGAGASDKATARTAHTQLTAAEQSLRGQADLLRATRTQLDRARAARARTAARLRAARRNNVKLRRDLRRVRRALRLSRARS